MKTLVAVMTCHRPSYQYKAKAQLETWIPLVRQYPGVDVIFFTGVPTIQYTISMDRELNRDTVTTTAPDNYSGIPLKVLAMLKWAAAMRYDHVLKVDDDVYVAPRRFPALLTSYDFVGRFRGPHGGYPAYFASGFGYMLSAKAVDAVLETPWNGDWMDERFVANALAARGIFGYSDDVNYCVTGPFTTPVNLINGRHAGGTVFCEYNANDIRQLHTLLGNAPLLPAKPLSAMPRMMVTAAQLAAAPRDKAPVGKVRHE